MNRLKKVTAVYDRIINLLALFAAVLLIFVMLAVLYEVVMRYFLNSPTEWVLQVTTVTLLFVTFLVTAWLLREEGHVKMDIMLSRLNPKAQSLINIITSILGVIACLLFIWHGVRVTWHQFRFGFVYATPPYLPKWPIVAIIPVGSFLLFIQFLRRTSKYLRIWRAS